MVNPFISGLLFSLLFSSSVFAETYSAVDAKQTGKGPNEAFSTAEIKKHEQKNEKRENTIKFDMKRCKLVRTKNAEHSAVLSPPDYLFKKKPSPALLIRNNQDWEISKMKIASITRFQ